MLESKLRKHTEDSIARRVPGIKATAKQYNALCSQLEQHKARSSHPSISPPQHLEIDNLFNPEANLHMWQDSGLDDDGEMIPSYLTQPGVRDGIAAMLMTRRVKEEQLRLSLEISHLTSWLASQLDGLERILNLCEGAFIPSWLSFDSAILDLFFLQIRL